MVSAPFVADYIIGSSETLLTPMQINKLAYISHGFTLAIEDEPLFPDRVEAWRYGPVIPSIYYMLSQYGGEPVTAIQYCGTDLATPEKKDRMGFLKRIINPKHKKITDIVLKKFGHFTGLQLSTITHEPGTPWHRRYKSNKLGIEIPNSLTREYYLDELRQ